MQKRKRIKGQVLSALCMTGLLFGMLTGCGTKPASTGANASSGASGNGVEQKAIKFTAVVPYSGEQPTPENPVIKKLEEATNSKITIEWTPMISYGDKYNVMMNSGQLPDVFIVPDLKASVFLDAAKNNQFWELSSYLSNENYSGFKNINKYAIQNCKTEGKLYVLPRERILKRQMVVYRSDWAEKAGLDEPDTIDKLYKMAKTFGEGDFDGNGKKDTIGLALGTVRDEGGSTIDNLNELIVANGGVNKWGIKDGNVISTITTPEYIKTIKMLRTMCTEGLISKDFPITKTTEIVSNFVDKEKTGLWLSMGIPGPKDPLYLAKKKTDSNAKLSDLFNFTYLKDSDGNPRSPAESGFNGAIAFPKSSIKEEARFKQILKVFNYISSKEGQILVNHGIEGLQYTKVDATHIKAIPKDQQKIKCNWQSINQLSICGNLLYASVEDPLVEKLGIVRKSYKDSELISDVTVPWISKEYSRNGAKLAKMIDTAVFKYILGEMDEKGLEDTIQDWRTSGGDKMAEEYTESYKQSQK